MFLVGILLAAFGVAVSIALHEMGHLIPAKRFGVKVTQYMVGFGPTVWSWRRGETEYGVKAIPLGGYIRMIGMFPPRPGQAEGVERASSTGRFGQLAEQMREESYEEIDPQDRDRVFHRLKSWQKVVVMFSGPFVNLIIASVLLTIIVCGFGLPKQTSAYVTAVQPCLSSAATTPKRCAPGDRSPAAVAGMKARDVIVSVAGKKVTTTPEATDVIQAHAGQTVPVVVRRDGHLVTLQVTPKLWTAPKLDGNGRPVQSASGKAETVTTGKVGIYISGTYRTERQPLTAAPGYIGSALGQTAGVFVKIPQKMVGVYNAAFGSAKRDANSPVSVVGVGRIAGDVAEAKGPSLQDKAAILIGIIASLNLALFVFNMIPLLPLDGGHIAGAVWEAVKRRIARARGITGPVYVDVTKALPVAYGVAIVLIAMSGLLMYADIVNPITLGN
ncbi:M50 family metallopeptidase [Leekyejoonella antrihumi]|uniref:Site-2 protease family protein n=1 Tax=Leekyejoonella antrihumi TaxID=1660198 RepID=A0A563DWW5_9MICO|nr:site-2 protease family protein [Leekyejoonella antrihumi]TWP34423.1 site-2 protease family protein [Leekyejoonella antrihumi]